MWSTSAILGILVSGKPFDLIFEKFVVKSDFEWYFETRNSVLIVTD